MTSNSTHSVSSKSSDLFQHWLRHSPSNCLFISSSYVLYIVYCPSIIVLLACIHHSHQTFYRCLHPLSLVFPHLNSILYALLYGPIFLQGSSPFAICLFARHHRCTIPTRTWLPALHLHLHLSNPCIIGHKSKSCLYCNAQSILIPH